MLVTEWSARQIFLSRVSPASSQGRHRSCPTQFQTLTLKKSNGKSIKWFSLTSDTCNTCWLNLENNPAYFAKLAVLKKNNHILNLSKELLDETLVIKILRQPLFSTCFLFFWFYFQRTVASKTDTVESARGKKPSVRGVYSALELRT